MRSSSSRGKPFGSSLNCSSDQPPSTAIQWPAGAVRTRSASMRSACWREVTPSNRSSSCSAARTQWAWLSIRPGMTVRPLRSMARVCGPLSLPMSAAVPVATMRPERMASACVIVKRSSTVTILPLMRMVSAGCAFAALSPASRAMATVAMIDDRMAYSIALNLSACGLFVDGDAGFLDHRAPLGHLGLEIGRKLGRCRADDADAKDLEPLTGGRIVQRRDRIGVELADDLGWSLRRREEPVPGGHVEAGHTRFRDRRQVGYPGPAFRTGDREPAQLAALDQRQYRTGVVEHHMDAARDQIVERRSRATIRHVQHLDSGHALEQLAGPIRRR